MAHMFENGQTLDHLSLAYSWGVSNLVVAVNKMDATEPPYSETRFLEIKEEVSSYLKKIKCSPNEVLFIPVSGLRGDNVLESSLNLSWYKGWINKGQITDGGIF